MPENEHFSYYLEEINLGFVEQEATPKLLMKLSIQIHLTRLVLSNNIILLIYMMVIGFDPPFTIEFTEPIYSQKLTQARITFRLMKS